MREPFEWVEIDLPKCSREFGVYPCGAAMEAQQSRTNLALYSEQFDNAYWSKVQATVTANAAIAPDGLTTADRLTDNAVSATHRAHRSLSFISGLSYTASCFFKAETISRASVVLPAAAFGTAIVVTFDLTAVTSTVALGSPTGHGIQSIGSGWYRCYVTGLVSVTAAGNAEFRLNNGTSDTYIGSGQSALFWGAQVEAGATMSGYKPTVAATVSAPHGGSVRKCFKSIATCGDVENFALGTPLTLKFSKANSPAPVGFQSFPVLENVSQSSTTVNIAGADPKFGALGRRSTLDFTLIDFPYHDRGVDPYQSGRADGTAQIDEAGYDPALRGTELAKIKARYPDYAGAETRLNRAYIDGGAFSDLTTYYHQLTEMAGPSDGKVSCKALDILDLANEKTALCPKPSQGVLTLDLTIGATSFDITPAEAAPTYAASGWLCIGSEVMAFTRAGVTFTVTRGQRRTVAATHSQGDTVQQTYSVRGARLDTVANDLIASFTTVNVATWVPFADWQAEVTRWGASILLETDICTPTPVATLLAEFGDLGCTIVPDERARKIRLRMNRPVDGDTVYAISDATAYDIKQEDLDDQRLTQVLFLCKRADPTKALTDNSNYLARRLTINNDALDIYKAIKSRTIATRWLDAGDDATASIVSWRTLKRFEKAPKRITARIDAAQKAINLMDVVSLTTDDLADAVGKAGNMQTQVIGRSEPTPYHDVSVILQRFDFDGRYGFIMQDTANVYGSATADEKATGGYIVDETILKFPDGTGPYKVI